MRPSNDAQLRGVMSILIILEKIGAVFLLVLIGYIFGRIVKPAEQARGLLSALVLNISVPASILAGTADADFNAIKGDMLLLIAISVGITLVTLLLSFPLSRLLEPKDALKRAVTQAAMYFHNYGFLGWPVCYMLLGTTGLLYAVLFSLPLNMLLYGITPMLLSRVQPGVRLFDKHMLINLPFYATLAALALLFAKVQLPGFMANLLNMLGSTQTPLAMMVVGMLLATVRLADVMHGVKVYGFSAIRIGLLPLLAFGVLKALGFSGLLLSVPVLITAMPAGAMSVVLVQRSGLDAVYASRLVVVSTLFSVITIPVMALLVV